MRKKEVIISNDKKDRHGDTMTLSALKQAKDITNSQIISGYKEHDFRNPPICRTTKAYILNHEGTNWLLGEMEIFDISDINKENTTKETKHKKMAIRKPVESGIAIIYDKGYIDNNLVDDVKELQKLINNKIEAGYELKKSFEFPDVLTICITVIGTNFLSGFLSKAGSDFWDCLKKIIKKNLILPNEKIYNFCFNINDEVEVMLVFTAPEPNDILDSLKNTQTLIEQHVTNYLVKNSKVRRIVFEYSKGKYIHLYSVYNDGTPFDISDIDKYTKILNSVKDTE